MATYEYSDKVVIIKQANGSVAVLTPAPECPLSLEQIIGKDVPAGTPYQVVNVSEVPADQTYFNAWTYEEN